MNCACCPPIVLGIVTLGFGAWFGWEMLREWIEERRATSDNKASGG